MMHLTVLTVLLFLFIELEVVNWEVDLFSEIDLRSGAGFKVLRLLKVIMLL